MATNTQHELDQIRENAAFAPLNDRAFLRITGSDATRWLNGMVTNSIQSLAPGEGNYNFLLNAQGRIQGDCTIYRDPSGEPVEFILESSKSQIDTIEKHLDHFIIMDDVQLAQILYIQGIVEARTGFALIGARAPELLVSLLGGEGTRSPSAAPPQGTMIRGYANGAELLVFAPPSSSIPYYELWCSDQREVDLILATLGSKISSLSAEAIEAHRILSKTPRFGQDIRDRDLPQETAQTHALHFSKGCYLGQEIVERIRSRGQVHRTFTAFRLTPNSQSAGSEALPTLPTPLEANGKPVGELTSAALIPLPEGPTLLALGYVRREALETHQPITYPGGIVTRNS